MITPSLPVTCIDWPDDGSESTESVWYLPQGVRLLGPVPVRFGVRIQRVGATFNVELLWNTTRLHWSCLRPAEIMTCSLAPLLKTLGYDLSTMLTGGTSSMAA